MKCKMVLLGTSLWMFGSDTLVVLWCNIWVTPPNWGLNSFHAARAVRSRLSSWRSMLEMLPLASWRWSLWQICDACNPISYERKRSRIRKNSEVIEDGEESEMEDNDHIHSKNKSLQHLRFHWQQKSKKLTKSPESRRIGLKLSEYFLKPSASSDSIELMPAKMLFNENWNESFILASWFYDSSPQFCTVVKSCYAHWQVQCLRSRTEEPLTEDRLQRNR